MPPHDPVSRIAPPLPRATERLLLRAHRADDLDDLCRFHSDPAVVRYVPWPVRDRAATAEALHTKISQARHLEPGEWLVLAVEERSTSRVIGEVLLKWTSETNRAGELGFAFAADAHGHGYAAEAATEMLALAFDHFDLHRVTAVCIEQNAASIRLLQRLGLEQEGRFVDSAFFKGQWVTQLSFATTADRWRNRTDGTADDVAAIWAAVNTFFRAFTSGEGADQRLHALRNQMLGDAVVVRTCGTAPAVYGVEEFIEPRRVMLTDGSLADFSEHATYGRVDVFGDIGHWFGSYDKSGFLNGTPYGGRGMKSVQLVRTPEGWRISAAAWDDERDGLTCADYAVRANAAAAHAPRGAR